MSVHISYTLINNIFPQFTMSCLTTSASPLESWRSSSYSGDCSSVVVSGGPRPHSSATCAWSRICTGRFGTSTGMWTQETDSSCVQRWTNIQNVRPHLGQNAQTAMDRWELFGSKFKLDLKWWLIKKLISCSTVPGLGLSLTVAPRRIARQSRRRKSRAQPRTGSTVSHVTTISASSALNIMKWKVDARSKTRTWTRLTSDTTTCQQIPGPTQLRFRQHQILDSKMQN